MTNTPGIVITGGSGRMGQMLINQVTASDHCNLVGVLHQVSLAFRRLKKSVRPLGPARRFDRWRRFCLFGRNGVE